MSRELRVKCSCENGVIITRLGRQVVGVMICGICKGFGMKYTTSYEKPEARSDNW